jgi:hypothetical protein
VERGAERLAVGALGEAAGVGDGLQVRKGGERGLRGRLGRGQVAAQDEAEIAVVGEGEVGLGEEL